MKHLIILLAAITSLTSAFAQTDVKDEKAKVILDKLSAKNKSYTSISASFVYKMENKDAGINEKQEGSVILKGNMYKLNIAGQEIYSNGSTVWTYIPDADEVQISEPNNNDEEGLNPSKIFTMYEKGFKYKYEGSVPRAGKQVSVIKLFPENPAGKPYHSVKMYVDDAKNQIESIEIFNKDGNIFTYELKTFETNKPFAESFFKFDVSQAGDVIDLR